MASAIFEEETTRSLALSYHNWVLHRVSCVMIQLAMTKESNYDTHLSCDLVDRSMGLDGFHWHHQSRHR